jgi:cytochrome d ubiquinol oxidase subunit II
MLLELSYLFFQQYWWVIISLLAGILVFLMFVQGGQTLIYTLGKNETERSIIVNSLGRKWEFTFTTLVTFGGGFFASFPLFYSTSFGGGYWLWMAILFCFVIQAISYEYRSKPANVLGARTFEVFLFINGAFGTTLIGVAVGTFFTGSEFCIDQVNKSVQWMKPSHGLEAVLNIRNLALGLAVFTLARLQAILYFMNNIDHDAIISRAKRQLGINAVPFVVFFLFFTGSLLIAEGYAVKPNGQVLKEELKYFYNFMEMPLVALLFVAGVVAVLWGIIKSLIRTCNDGIWYTGAGTIVVVVSLFIIAGFNNTAFYPSSADLASSLTITNASSSHYTLKIMSLVSLLVPFVVAYIWYAWKSINNKKINVSELEQEDHNY